MPAGRAAVFDVSRDLRDLEPVQLRYRQRGLCQSVLDCVIKRSGRTAGKIARGDVAFDELTVPRNRAAECAVAGRDGSVPVYILRPFFAQSEFQAEPTQEFGLVVVQAIVSEDLVDRVAVDFDGDFIVDRAEIFRGEL